MTAGITLRRLRRADVPLVRRLIQLYMYDLGGERWDVEPDGTFAPPAWHRAFWRRRGSQHYVVRVRGRPAGFALVREPAHFAGPGVREIAEFFVLRQYRRRGVGTHVARDLLARSAGRWEIAVLTWNPARRFWRRVIRELAAGRPVARRRRHGDLPFVVWHFETMPRSARTQPSRPRRMRRPGGRGAYGRA